VMLLAACSSVADTSNVNKANKTTDLTEIIFIASS